MSTRNPKIEVIKEKTSKDSIGEDTGFDIPRKK
jgi:hypothetical protein